MTIHDGLIHAPLTRQQRYAARKRIAGVCIKCGRKAVTARLCARHRDNLNAERREKWSQR